jgi:transcriptional regulator with XRE-family HTH domain
MATFDEFIAELEAEAQDEGPQAVAELEAFRLHFSLARQLAEQRRARNLTQKQLAEMAGVDQAEISRIERGQANPTTATLGALTKALGVDVRLVPADHHDERNTTAKPGRTGPSAASAAGRLLASKSAPKAAKRAAASDLAQVKNTKRTGKAAASAAGRTLASPSASKAAKRAAAST